MTSSYWTILIGVFVLVSKLVRKGPLKKMDRVEV